MAIGKGECVSLLGPNGMGKTTTLRTIMGLTRARRGLIQFEEMDITHYPPFKIARLGISYIPEDRGIFDTLTVVQNLRIPFLNLKTHNSKKWLELEERIYTLFPVLRGKQKRLAGTLSGGEQQMLSTARALISGEKMILLDEPTEGLAPIIIQQLIMVIKNVKAQGHTLLLVEQNTQTALETSDRCYFLEKGNITQEASIDEIRINPDILRRHMVF